MPEPNPSEQLHLRSYRRDDLDALFRLDELCFEPPFRFSRRAMRSYAEARHARVVIGEIAGGIVGFCILHLRSIEGALSAYVVTLDVAPELRRHGIASALMAHAEQQAQDEGCAQIFLHVHDENDAAIQFYQRSGYALAGHARNFYGQGRNGLLYRKELAAGDSSLAS